MAMSPKKTATQRLASVNSSKAMQDTLEHVYFHTYEPLYNELKSMGYAEEKLPPPVNMKGQRNTGPWRKKALNHFTETISNMELHKRAINQNFTHLFGLLGAQDKPLTDLAGEEFDFNATPMRSAGREASNPDATATPSRARMPRSVVTPGSHHNSGPSSPSPADRGPFNAYQPVYNPPGNVFGLPQGGAFKLGTTQGAPGSADPDTQNGGLDLSALDGSPNYHVSHGELRFREMDGNVDIDLDNGGLKVRLPLASRTGQAGMSGKAFNFSSPAATGNGQVNHMDPDAFDFAVPMNSSNAKLVVNNIVNPKAIYDSPSFTGVDVPDQFNSAALMAFGGPNSNAIQDGSNFLDVYNTPDQFNSAASMPDRSGATNGISEVPAFNNNALSLYRINDESFNYFQSPGPTSHNVNHFPHNAGWPLSPTPRPNYDGPTSFGF